MTFAQLSFDDLKRLNQRKHREQLGFFLAEGEHLVLELGKAVARHPELASSCVFISEDYRARGLPAGFPTHLRIETLGSRQMDQLSDTRTPQGVIAAVPMLKVPQAMPSERAIYLHQIQDPGNLGTILRTLAWFGGFRCLLSPDSVDPYNSKVIRASMGAIFTVPFETEITLETLQQRYPKRALLDLGGKSLATDEFKTFDCYMFGSEATGAPADLRSQLANCTYSIPGGSMTTDAGVESLNLAATVNICVYELVRRT